MSQRLKALASRLGFLAKELLAKDMCAETLLVKVGMLRGLAHSPTKANAVLQKSGNKRSNDSHD